ncbi:MAG: TetR/AcrR family transcriptional regulator [Candidatus Marinimicrobia bacterium]|nr:TetR/AcrR family transcriptional regulator [Candidatus Neomarinimicrobiota bacterium]MCF7827800.1 TetR/AcrR family transcriptional regulator [Candidatus Neomarinimicrobiota bacterium]MCF7879445.1 TetR/AcrR family transcriptional regulator [Candidatus Neomarinimicrobiota bacterium]
MPKSFSSEEKTEIKNALLQTGEDLFSTFGLKKTTVEDLTEAVGIAKGSFYSFFESKEVLYFEIFRREEKKLKGKVLMQLSGKEFSAPTFRDFLLEAFRLIGKNPIIRRMYLEDEYRYLARKLPQEYLDQHTSEDISELTPLIHQWQDAGQMIRRDPEIITSAIRALFLMILHRNEIGDDYFDDTVELLAESIANQLIPEERP